MPTNTETETKEKQLALAHCGEFLVKEDEIMGWFHPIPLETWEEIIGFHKWMSLKTKSETVSYHRWNTETKEYDIIIPYQTTSRGGLSVSTNWTDPRNIALLDDYALLNKCEFFPACTIHTHVAAPAFESGTDAGDEEDQPGWHITLGHLTLSHKKMDLHVRFRLPQLKSVKEIVSTSDAYEIEHKKLFMKGVTDEQIVSCSHLNTKLRIYEDRVSFH